MKKIKLLLASLLFLGITMFSCKVVDVEDIDSNTNERDLKVLSRARNSYEERLKNEPILKKFNIKPMWNSNSVVVSKNTIELPFTIDDVFRLPFIEGNKDIVGRERLVFIEKGSKFIPYIIRYMPTKLFKGDIKKVSTINAKKSNFDGIISVRTLEKTGVTILHFANGKMYKKYKGKIVSDKNKKGRVTGWIYREPWVTLGWDGHEIVFNYHDGVLVQTNDENNNGNDNDDDPSFCDEHPTVCTNWEDPGSGGGGNNNGNYVASQDIKNDVSDPCISGVVNNFLQSSHGINGIIQGVFSCNTDVNLVFSNAALSGDEGVTNVEHANPDKSIFDVNVTINNSQANYSKEYIASTVIHEVLHAYMNYTGRPLGNDPQHLAMGNSYVNLMRDYLQTMYGINSTDATILSLGGLESYPWFSSLLSSRNISSNQYWQTKQDFKDKTSGTGCP